MIQLKKETVYKGIPVSSGVAVSKVCMFSEQKYIDVTLVRIAQDQVAQEIDRLNKASERVAVRLENLKNEVKNRIGTAESEIFAAQKMILEDISLKEKLLKTITDLQSNAEFAVVSIFDEYEKKLLQVDNEYIKERASDIGELKRRLLNELSNTKSAFKCEGQTYCKLGNDCIVVAKELTPILTMELSSENLNGFVTERGGATSHAAILARALGIPAVSGIKDITDIISCGTEILVNGYTGEVILWPTEQTIESVQGYLTDKDKLFKPVKPLSELKVMANISLVDDANEAKKMFAEGIGLYRTEYELLSAGKMLSEDEQFKLYKNLFDIMDGDSVVFRLLDIGGDKHGDFLNIHHENNPQIGLRGSRLLAARPDIFKLQARALARASQFGEVNVLYPMIVSLEQFRKLKKIFWEYVSDLSVGKINHGIMFEVPSACLQAEDIMREADFASIGTNDLVQFFFAIDRNNELVAFDYDLNHSPFWDLLKSMVQAAKKHNKPISMCGELAGDPVYLDKLMDIGLDCISVSSRLIPKIRRALMDLTTLH